MAVVQTFLFSTFYLHLKWFYKSFEVLIGEKNEESLFWQKDTKTAELQIQNIRISNLLLFSLLWLLWRLCTLYKLLYATVLNGAKFDCNSQHQFRNILFYGKIYLNRKLWWEIALKSCENYSITPVYSCLLLS